MDLIIFPFLLSGIIKMGSQVRVCQLQISEHHTSSQAKGSDSGSWELSSNIQYAITLVPFYQEFSKWLWGLS